MNLSNTLEDLSREDLLKVVARDRFVKEQLSARLAGVLHENTELIGVINELQEENQALRQAIEGVEASHDQPHGE